MPDPRSYPVLSATLVAPAVVWLAARYFPGLELTDEQATIIATGALGAGSLLATTLVRSRRSLPDPDATKGPKVVQAFEPTTYVHHAGVPDPLPTRPDSGQPAKDFPPGESEPFPRPKRQRPRE